MNIYSHKRNFKKNKYRTWYYSIIENVLKQDRNKIDVEYYERHHVLPKCIFPEYKKETWNIVLLTPREHFICHLLLTKMTKGLSKYQMIYALKMFMNIRKIGNRKNYKINSKWYEYFKKIKKEDIKSYWTRETRNEHSRKLRKYNQTVDKKSQAYHNRIEKIRQYQLNKEWSNTAIETRLANCLRNADKRKGKTWSAARRASYVKRVKSVKEREHLSRVMKGRKTSSGMLGKHHSQETIDKIRESNRGRVTTQNFKGYWYLSPTGQEILFCPIIETAKLYNLQEEGLRKLRLGMLKKNKHKGWSFVRQASEAEINAIINEKGKK